jgi:hypothetical protein
MDTVTAQALHDLQQTGRLSAEVDYEVRDTLDLVSEEEAEAHDERVKREQAEVKANKDADSEPAKPTANVRKGN